MLLKCAIFPIKSQLGNILNEYIFAFMQEYTVYSVLNYL
uniref:Uncharacterized protein n=1 Tax=Myoviridae sp. ctBoB21 TaxID=2827287 RepID=A0A8S5R5L6_9CAUD|nr:MAG TPA: hypothetical protein [Myoviridae sp. ctBoB21]